MTRELLRILGRHKVLASLLVVLSVALAAGAFFVAPAQYESKAQVLLVPPIVQTENGPTNPFLEFNGAIFQTASVLQLSVTDLASADAVVRSGGYGEYTVVPSLGDNAGPVLIVTATGPDAAQVTKTVQLVETDISATLSKLQSESGADRATWISVVTLIEASRPVRLYQAPVRLAIAAFAIAGAVSLSILFLAERRRRSRDARKAGPAMEVVPSVERSDSRSAG